MINYILKKRIPSKIGLNLKEVNWVSKNAFEVKMGKDHLTSPMRVTILPILGYQDKDEIKKVKKKIKRKMRNGEKTPHEVLICCKQGLNIREHVNDLSKSIPIKVVNINIEGVHIQQLIALAIAKRKDLKIDKEKLHKTFQKIHNKKDFGKKITKVLDYDEITIHGLTKSPEIETTKDLMRGYSFFLAFPEQEMEIEEVWERTQKIRGLQFFGGRGGIPSGLDLENKEDLLPYAKSLENNKYLESSSSKWKIKQTPIERRIFNLLDKECYGNEVEKKTIQASFINISNNRRLFSDVIWEILERRGRIGVGNKVKMKSLDEVMKEARDKYAKFKRFLKEKKENGILKKFGIFGSVKQRNWNVISLGKEIDSRDDPSYERILENLSRRIDNEFTPKEVRFRLSHLLNMILNYLSSRKNSLGNKSVKELFRDSVRRASKYKDTIQRKNNEIESNIKKIKKDIRKKLGIKIKLNLRKVNKLQELTEEFEKTYQEDLDYEQVKKYVKNKWESLDENEQHPFYFDSNTAEDEYFWNFKLFKLHKTFNKFEKVFKEVEDNLQEVINLVEELGPRMEKIREEIGKLEDKYPKIGSFINETMKIAKKRSSEEISQQEVKISELKERLESWDGLFKDIQGMISERLQTEVFTFREDEKDYQKETKILEESIDKLKKVLGGRSQYIEEEIFEGINESNKELSDIRKKYEKIKENLGKKIDKIKKDLAAKRKISKIFHVVNKEKKAIEKINDNIQSEKKKVKNSVGILQKGLKEKKKEKGRILSVLKKLRQKGGISSQEIKSIEEKWEKLKEEIHEAQNILNNIKKGIERGEMKLVRQKSLS